jgi:hypothetical protein
MSPGAAWFAGERFAVDPVALALVGAALFAAVGLAAWFGGRRRGALIALQPVAAGLLLAALSVRDASQGATLAVFTPGADPAALTVDADVPRVALPGAAQGEGIEAVPDLATALRRHPASHLVVIGEGLPARDREAVGTRSLAFQTAPEPSAPAVFELDAPSDVRAGAWWTLRGRTRATSGATLVLLDPAGAEVAETKPGEDGRFVLEAVARAAGAADFELQLRVGDEPVQSLPVSVLAHAAPPLRALLLAAAPSPELKYLRRWALDAGMQLEARIALAPGLAQRRGAAALDAAQLAELDLLIVDERSWPQLAALQPALREAVAAGLGLLLRTTGPVPERVAQEWAGWGFAAPTGARPQAVRLALAPQTELHAWTASADAVLPVLLAARDGTPLAQWRAHGRGRVGRWGLADTHRLYTRGERERHATLWSEAFATLARARGERTRQLPSRALIGERAVLCDVAPEVSVVAPGGEETPLPVERGCAAFWPRTAGWHRVRHGAGEHRFRVHDPSTLAAVLAHERRAATQALVRGSAPAAPASVMDRDLLRALLLAAWLAAMAAAWWLERRRGEAVSVARPAEA